jgi:integrase
MGTPEIKSEQSSTKKGSFEKVGECLYRYTSNGIYYARVEKEGKEFRRSLKTADRALAKRRLADFQREIGRTLPGANRITVAQLCDKYLETQQHLEKSTREDKGRIIRRMKDTWPEGGNQALDKIRSSHVEAWLSAQGSTRSASSLNSFIEVVRGVFALAVRDRLLADSPAAALTYRKRKKPIRKTPTPTEFAAIVADIRNQSFNADAKDSADFVEFIGLAGLGQAETSALTWADVDWQNEQITTFRKKTSRGFMVPLYPQLRPLLERMRQERGGNPPGDERVFRLKDAKKAISGACKRLGLPAYSHRSFRRMFITRAIEHGVDVKVIAEWQGHRDGGKLILDTYSHVAPKHSARMAKLMSEEEEG